MLNFKEVLDAMKPRTMLATLNGNKVELEFMIGDPGILIWNLDEKGERLTEKSSDGTGEVSYACTFGFEIFRHKQVIGTIVDLQPVVLN